MTSGRRWLTQRRRTATTETTPAQIKTFFRSPTASAPLKRTSEKVVDLATFSYSSSSM